MALMLEQLAVHRDMAVLEIGTGTGYNAALLGQLVGPGGAVLTVDVDPAVTGPATRHLTAAGASNVEVVTADGWALETAGPLRPDRGDGRGMGSLAGVGRGPEARRGARRPDLARGRASRRRSRSEMPAAGSRASASSRAGS